MSSRSNTSQDSCGLGMHNPARRKSLTAVFAEPLPLARTGAAQAVVVDEQLGMRLAEMLGIGAGDIAALPQRAWFDDLGAAGA